LSGRTQMSQFGRRRPGEPIQRPSSLWLTFRWAGNRASCRRGQRSGLVRPFFDAIGGSWSQANWLILIACSARRSYRGEAGGAVARSTITGLATVWSAPRQVMTHQPAAAMLRYQPADSPKVSGITNPPAVAG